MPTYRCPPVIKSTDTQRSRGHRHHGDTADLGAVARKPTSKGGPASSDGDSGGGRVLQGSLASQRARLWL